MRLRIPIIASFVVFSAVPAVSADEASCAVAVSDLAEALTVIEGKVTDMPAVVKGAVGIVRAECGDSLPGIVSSPSATSCGDYARAFIFSNQLHLLTISALGVSRSFSDSGSHVIRTYGEGGHHTAEYSANGANIDLTANNGGTGQIFVGPAAFNGVGTAGANCNSAGSFCQGDMVVTYLGVLWSMKGTAHVSQSC